MKIKIQRNLTSTLMKGLMILVFGMIGNVSWGQTTVSYVEQTSYFNAGTVFTSGTSGVFDPNVHQMGMYSHGTSPQVVAWRKFKTDGINVGSDRPLKVGDIFTISLSATRAFGQMGFALLASPTSRSNYTDNINNVGIAFFMDNFGAWYAKYGNGSGVFSATSTGTNTIYGTQGSFKSFTFTLTLTAPDRMNAVITDGTTTTNFYDLLLNTSNPITEYSTFLSDDWDGFANQNIYWSKSSTTDPDNVTNNLICPIGSSNNTYSITSIVPDGFAANSTSTPSINALTKSGSGTITLSAQNTYTGLTTVSAGTLRLNRSGGTTIPVTNNVTVNGGTLQISSNQTLNNLTISSGGITIDDGVTLTINGTLTYSDGTMNYGSTTTGNLVISNSGVLIVSSGTFTTSGRVTIQSNVSGTGSIGNSAGTISGNVSVERYIPALGVRGRFRFIASPVAGRTISDWMNNFYITGPGTGTTLGDPNSNLWHTSNANIINATVTATSVLTYNEASISGDLNTGWTNLSATSQAITPGLGFRAFLRGTNNGTPTNVTYTPQIGANANSQTQAAFTITLSGAITNLVNAGTVTIPATFNSSGTLANDGWNLVGNPYPSTIDWNAASGWTKTNIGATIWIFNPNSNSYGNWDGATPTNSVTRYISSGQAFFIKASASPTFSCSEAVKVSTAGASIFKSAEVNTLRIGLVKDESNKDETVIRFMEGKNNEFSEDDDVTKYYNPTVNVSSYFGADKYASVNYLKNELVEDKIIPISAWVDEVGNYKLNFTGMNDFTLSKNIFLKDKFLNTITDVEINPTVDFVITSDSNSKGDNRFEVVFVAKSSTATKEDLMTLSSTNLTVYPNPTTDLLNISLSNSNFKNSNIVVYNVSGMEVSKSTMNGANAQLNIESLSNGVYFVKVSNENGFSKTVKFIK